MPMQANEIEALLKESFPDAKIGPCQREHRAPLALEFCGGIGCAEKTAQRFKEYFPAANLLITTKDDLHADRFAAFAGKAAYNDWDCVVMTHNGMGKLNVSKETERAFLDRELWEAEQMLSAVKDEGGYGSSGSGV